jgi:hypothetical protein
VPPESWEEPVDSRWLILGDWGQALRYPPRSTDDDVRDMLLGEVDPPTSDPSNELKLPCIPEAVLCHNGPGPGSRANTVGGATGSQAYCSGGAEGVGGGAEGAGGTAGMGPSWKGVGGRGPR